MANPDPHAGGRLRHVARLARAERRILAVVRDALATLSSYALAALRESSLDPAVLETTIAPWRNALTGEVGPAITAVFNDAWEAIGRGVVDPAPYATRHLESVWNRLSGTSDEVFDSIRGVLAAGHQEGLSIRELTGQIEELLTGADAWDGRARTIARTEAIAANNAGAAGSARATAEYLGLSPDQVTQSWLATGDGRTRASHVEADGQTVTGLDTPFVVGGYELAYPGDPDGPPEETVNCRCTTLYEYPEVDAVAASANQEATMTTTPRWTALTAAAEDGDPLPIIVCALPTASDPVNGIGEEQKHATLCYLGPDDGTVDSTAVKDAIETWLGLAETAPHPPEGGIETVDEVDALGDGGARVWLIEPGGVLSNLRDGLMGLEPIGDLDRANNEHPEFTPHVTIGYAEDAEGDADLAPEVEAAAEAVTRITFDRVAVWAGTEQTEYALVDPSAETEETPVAEDETVAASGRTTLLTRTPQTGDVEQRIRANIDRLVDGGFGTREQIAHALGRALTDPIRDGGLQTRGPRPVTAAAGDPAPEVADAEAETMDAGDPAPVLIDVPVEDRPNADRFHGICTVEDEQTGDGRVFAPGSIYWDESGLPMPLGWQVADAPGHDGSVICGRIDSFERVGNAITYTGTWDLDGAGWETRRLVDGQYLRGISVDTDDTDVVLVTPDGEPVDMFDMMMEGGDLPIMVMQRSRLRSAALCRVPAFAPSGTEGAYIVNGLPEDLQAAVDAELPPAEAPADEVVVEALVAAAVAYGAPALDVALPPTEWFSNPGLEQPTPITITADGRVYGHLAAWGTCHIGVQGSCVTPPRSQTDYANFAHGVTMTAGGPVITGLLTMGTGHAAADLRPMPAAAHYDDTGSQFATVSVGEDAIGIWVAGALRPTATPEQVDAVRAAGALSGDWRRIRGNLELVAALAVNTPGFPIPRLSVAASAEEGQTSLVAAGIVTAGAQAVAAGQAGLLTFAQVRDIVQQELATDRRRGRVQQAAARLRAHRVARATARLERV